MSVIPVSAVIPTANRARRLQETLESLAKESVHPFEIIIVDASKSNRTKEVCAKRVSGLQARVGWVAAKARGAAAQRNQGVALASQPFILFLDDDIVFKRECVRLLWQAIQSDRELGGVNAMIVNQHYGRPGLLSRMVFTLLNGRPQTSFAGRVIGPAVNLLPEDRQDLPAVVPVDWLNLGCTIYRREALPNPPFPVHFTGYSLMEDLALSLTVGKTWKLANARTARIFHDSQPADYKSDAKSRSCMEVVNRHFIMRHVLSRTRVIDFLKLALWESFQLVGLMARSESRRSLKDVLVGKVDGVKSILARRKKNDWQ